VNIYEKDAVNERPVRVQIQVLDRKDGTYIVRYRLYESYKNLLISIKNKLNIHVANSPYQLRGWLYDESCSCPIENLSDWYKQMRCNDTYTQIEKDMSKFANRTIDMHRMSSIIVNTFNQRYSQSLCHYVVLSNRVYRKCYGEHVGFSMFSDSILLSLTKKVNKYFMLYACFIRIKTLLLNHDQGKIA
jgi:hypothetical protein